MIKKKRDVKFIIVITLFLLVIVGVTGCNFFQNEQQPPTSNEQQPIIEKEDDSSTVNQPEQDKIDESETTSGNLETPVESFNIAELALDFEVYYSVRREHYRNEDGVKVLELYTVFPKIISASNQDTADYINDYFSKQAGIFIAETERHSLIQAEDDYLVKSDLGFDFQAHYYESVTSFYYQADEKLVFLVQDYYNHGGPRPLIITEASIISIVDDELVIDKQELVADNIAEQLQVATSDRVRVELNQEYINAAVRLLDNNLDMVMNIYYLDMLPMEIPESGIPEDNLVLVKHPYLKSFTDLEAYVKSTYAQEQAELLLNDGRYLGIYGRLYADISKLAGVGYYTDLFNYQFKLEGIQKNSAELTIMTIDDYPGGREEVEIRTKILREQGRLVLNNMLY